jgi:hypothetical protein
MRPSEPEFYSAEAYSSQALYRRLFLCVSICLACLSLIELNDSTEHMVTLEQVVNEYIVDM